MSQQRLLDIRYRLKQLHENKKRFIDEQEQIIEDQYAPLLANTEYNSPQYNQLREARQLILDQVHSITMTQTVEEQSLIHELHELEREEYGR